MFWLALDIILPLGQYTISVNVNDAENGLVSAIIAECDIQLHEVTSTDCIDLQNDIIDPYLIENEALLSKRSKYLFIFQTLQAALFYLPAEPDECKFELFVDVIELLSHHFGSNTTDLCESDYLLVCKFVVFVLVFFSFWIAYIICLFIIVRLCGIFDK